jgi:antitoxin component YwqK of YwqJK toxin-antitoxin module
VKKFFILIFFLIASSALFSQEGEINQFDSNGKQTGFWKKYYENGKIKYEGTFKEGKPVGKMIRYFPEGAISAELFFSEDGITSHATLYYLSGKKAAEGKYIDQRKDSTWNYFSFYNDRLTITEEWVDGKKHGMTKKYYDDGKVAEITEWKNGVQDGIWEQYYENNQLRLKTRYKEGKRTGIFVSYTPEGLPFIKGQYSEGLMDGTWVYYDENGNPDITGEYIKGIQQTNPELKQRLEEFSRQIDEIIANPPEPNRSLMR